MTTIVTVTGTGTPLPDPNRAGAGTHVQFGDVRLQFDAGRMTLNRLTQMQVQPRELTAVFLTHYHSDHLTGLSDLLLTHWVTDWEDEWSPVDVVAPHGPTTDFVERMFTIWDNDLAVRALHGGRSVQPKVVPIGFDVPPEPTEIWTHGDVRVVAGQVRHEPVQGAVGYRVETPDGVVVISGDTRVCDEMADLATGADVLVYEAMRTELVLARSPTRQYVREYHADTVEIGAQAEAIGVPTVMLTHLIPGPTTESEKQAFADDVRAGGYTGRLIVCDDLSSFTLDESP